MNIKTLSSLFFICLGLVPILGSSQNTYVPDDNFEQALIDLGYDSGPLDDYVPTANINTVKNLDIHGKNIADLRGIESFLELTILNCDQNVLTDINISENTKLRQLFCRENELTKLDVSKNTALNILWCSSNKISALDLTKNVKLTSLVCSNNMISDLNVSKNSSLNVLNFEYNTVSSIDLKYNEGLITLVCGNNLLTDLDLSKNLEISLLDCEHNYLTHLDVALNNKLTNLFCEYNQLSILDLSNNITLKNLNCSDNDLCLLNVKNGNNNNITAFRAYNNPDLSCIFVDVIEYSTLNWTEVDSNSNFVTNQAECSVFDDSSPVDILDDFLGLSYTLPVLTNGSYFTESSGNGSQLFPGDVITSSQTLFIYDPSGCIGKESSFNIIISDKNYYIPKYFTPNNDGVHDYWRVLDFANTINVINIYNRYGKLLKSLSTNSNGWDGTYRGQQLESNDYWYAITLNSGEIIKGHFTLKR